MRAVADRNGGADRRHAHGERAAVTTAARATMGLEPLERRTFLSAGGGAGAAGALAKAAAAGPKTPKPPQVVEPHATVRGLTLGEWAAEWSKWALAQPPAVNPVIDPTGAFAGVGQGDKVFFLAGTFESGVVTRNIVVPSGTPLFFPVLNEFWVTVEGVDPPFASIEDDIRAGFDASTATWHDYFATIDGRPVPNLIDHVEEDPPGGFQIDFPADNIFGADPSILGTVATQGIYVMTNPLTPGTHTVHFGGVNPTFNYEADVTYNITVIPKGQYRKLPQPVAPAAAAAATAPFSSGPSIAATIFGGGGDESLN